VSRWKINPEANPEAARAFASLEAVFALQGELITSDPLSNVIRVTLGGQRFYVKRYTGAGKGLRRYLGRPRVKAEWQNLRLFAKWGLATATIIAYGLERKLGAFSRGALITLELEQTQDLAAIAALGDPRLKDRHWVSAISRQVATGTRAMHDHHFVHNDLKWRNLLVNPQAQLFFIDCPAGSFWWGPWLRYRIIKDLACLDKIGKYQLSRSQRLRFYLQYRGRTRLNASDKRRVRRIVKFFEGRE
jgi:hypothetical protein